MKKYVLSAFTILMFLINCNIVKAKYTSTNPNCEGDGTCILLCNYYNKVYVNELKNTNKEEIISIYYNFNNKKYSIEWRRNNVTEGKNSGSLSDLFSKSGKNVYLEGEAKISENNFQCPQYGYIDYGLYGGNELCFDNDNKSCTNNHNDVNTKFGKSYKLFISGGRNYDVVSQIDTYYNSSAYKDFKCEEIIDYSTGKFKLTSTDIANDLWKDFDTNFLHGNTAPNIISNLKNARSNQLLENIIKYRFPECRAEDQKAVAEGIITQEEANKREEMRNNIDIDNVKSTIETGYNNYLEGNINTPSGDPSLVQRPDNVEPMDICSQNGVKQVLHIAGYILFVAKLVIPLLLIIMGTIDVVNALKDPDDKTMKDSMSKFAKRIIAAVIIFFIPTIVNFGFSLIDDATDFTNFSECGECIFRPTGGGCNYTLIGEDE